MLNLGTLMVKLGADSTALVAGIGEAARTVEKFSNHVKRVGREATALSAILVGSVGAAMHEAAANNLAVADALEHAKHVAEALADAIATTMLPAFRQMTDKLSGVVAWFQRLSPEMRSSIASFISTTVAVLGVMVVLGHLFGILSMVAGAVSSLAAIVGGVLSAAFGFLLSPIGLVVVILGVLIGVGVYFRTELTGAVKTVGEAFLSTFKVVGNFVEDVFTSMLKHITGSINDVLDALKYLLEKGSLVATALGKNDFAEQMFDAGQALGHVDLGKSLGHAFDAATNRLIDGVHVAGSTLKDAGTAFVGIVGKAWEGAKGVAGALKDKAASMMPDFSGQASRPGSVFDEAGLRGLKQGDRGTAVAQLQSDLIKLGRQIDETEVRFGVFGTSTQAAVDSSTSLGGVLAQTTAAQAAYLQTLQKVNVAVGASLAAGKQKGTFAVISSASEQFGRDLKRTFAYAQATIEDHLLSGMGLLSTVIQNAEEGGAAGGAPGAIGAAIGTLLVNSRQMGETANILNAILQQLADALGELLGPIEPLLGAVDDLIGGLLKDLAPAFALVANALDPLIAILEPLATVVGGLAPVFKALAPLLMLIFAPLTLLVQVALPLLFPLIVFVGRSILVLAQGLGTAWNAIVGAVQAILRQLADVSILGGKPLAALSGWADSLNGATVNMSGLAGSIADLDNMTYASANARARETAAVLRMGSAAQQASEQIANAPSGYKVSLARFLAAQAQGVGGTGTPGSPPAGGSGAGPASGPGGARSGEPPAVHVYLDGSEMIQRLRVELRQDDHRRTGTNVGVAPRYAGT